VSPLSGTRAMARLVLRRDRVRLAVWVLALLALVLSSVASVTSLYATASQREAYTAAVGDNPVAVIMGGPGTGLPSLGAIVVFEVAVVGYVAVGLMSVLLVVRSTRAEEEAGRTELLRAGPVGRWAGPAAALAVVAGADLAVGVGTALGTAALGLDLSGSLALGASLAAFGLVMAAVALLAAQVSEHARAASGLGAALLGAFFVLRAAGDVGDGALSWASPMGWALAVRPFAGERWAVLLLPLALAVALATAALLLLDRRDVGAGLVAVRPGPATASSRLAGPLGLAVRQHRAAVAGWGAGLFLLGAAYGSVGESVQELVSQNEALAAFLAAGGTDLVDSFFALAAAMMALAGGGLALQVATRVRAEEVAGRLEPLLATALPRWRSAAAHLVVAAVGVALVLALAGLGLGLAHAALTEDAGQVPRLLGAALVHVPAAWVLVGATALLFGWAPRATGAAWALLAGSAVVVLLGQTLRLPGWVVDLSPFSVVPAVPAEHLAVAPLVWLTALALALAAAGVAGLARRDVG